MSTIRWGNLAGLLQFCLGRHYPSGLWLVINTSNLNGWPVLAGIVNRGRNMLCREQQSSCKQGCSHDRQSVVA